MGTFFPAVAGFLKAIFVGAAAGSSAAYVFAVNVARVGLLALTSKVTQPKLDFSQTAQAKKITVRDTIAPQKFTYGEDYVSGPIIFANTGGVNNVDMYYCIALTGHESDSVLEYKIDDTVVSLGDLSGTSVVSGKFANVMSLEFLRGTSAQARSTILGAAFNTLWTTSHTARGWTTMVVKMTVSATNDTAYKSGAPRNYAAKIRGRRIYDPRLDSTNGGAGAHRLADPTTWEWSSNPALCLADYLRDDKFGMKEEDDRIDWSMVATAADVCEESVTVPSGTQDRYTCNATFSGTQRRMEVRDALVGAMLGRLVFSQGLWKMWAGEAVTADVTLTEANLAGSIQVQASSGSKERYNRVVGKFVDASRDYVPATYPEVRSTVFELADNSEPEYLVIDFNTVQNTYEAQRNAIIMLKKSRNQRVVVFEGNWSCFRIQPGSVVSLTIDELGFTADKFFVSDWRFGSEGITLTLVEETDSVWANPSSPGDYTVRSATGALSFSDIGVPPATLVSAVSVFGGALLTWTNPPQGTFDHIEIWVANENVRGSALLIGTSAGTTFYDNVSSPQQTRYYWIRSVNVNGEASAYSPDATTSTFTAFPLITQRPMVADPFIRQGSSFWDVTDSNASYVAGHGLNSTDVLRLTTDASFGAFAWAEERRGPDEWDVIAADGATIEVRYRVAMHSAGGGFGGYEVLAAVKVSDENGANANTYVGEGAHQFLHTDALEEYYEMTSIVTIDGEAAETPPRFLQIGVQIAKSPNSPQFDVDFIDASYSPGIFSPVNAVSGLQKPVGLVPTTGGEVAGRVLKDDGTWGQNPSGQKDGRFVFSTSTASADPGAGNVRFNNATLASVTAIYVSNTDADGMDSATILGFLASGNKIYVEQSADSTKSAVFQVTGAPTDNTTWHSIPVSVTASATLPDTSGSLNFNIDFSAAGGGGGMADLIDDTTPQLGGDLDMNTFAISSSLTVEDVYIGLENAAATATSIAARNSAGGIEVYVDPTTGHCRMQQISSAGADEGDWLVFTRSGAVSMYYGGSLRAATVEYGLNVAGGIFIVGQASIPINPPAGSGLIWMDSSDDLWFRNDLGTSVQLNATGGLNNVVEDTTPQLGGNLASNTFDILMADSDSIYFGTGNDALINWNGTILQFNVAGDWSLKLNGGAENAIYAVNNGAVRLYWNNVQCMATRDYTATGVTSGATVRDHTGTARGVGFNVLPAQATNVSVTLAAQHCGGVILKNNTTARAVTCEASGSLDFPVGGVVTIINDASSGDITVNDGGTALKWLDGSDSVDVLASCVIAPGGVATIWRQAAGTYLIWGSGITDP